MRGSGFDAPAGLSDSLVRRANTEIPAMAAPSTGAARGVHGDARVPGDATKSSGAIRRTATMPCDLPPIVSDDHLDRVLEHRLSKSTISPISVKFTSELADKHGLTQWKRTALAVTGARRLAMLDGPKSHLRRTDSRIAGTIERQQELERANLDDSLSGFDDGVQLLEVRLAKTGLKTVQMGDDGNCQFRALSFNLFGSQDHHQLVRDTCVAHIVSMEDEYGIFFEGNEFERYCREMAMSRTWGDELTLRACSDAFQVPIHVAGHRTVDPPSQYPRKKHECQHSHFFSTIYLSSHSTL